MGTGNNGKQHNQKKQHEGYNGREYHKQRAINTHCPRRLASWHSLDNSNTPSSSCAKSKCGCEMLCLGAGERFRKCVCGHLLGRTINEFDCSLLDNPTNKVETYVNVLCPCVVLAVFCDFDRRLIIGE